jgi:phosphoribosyl-ATP pyrophosphohydrolase/phosphoribosyl-AMP cyclohydrolase
VSELTPAVVQDAITGRVLMLGWMNDEALARTRETGLVHFWSRARQRLWQKGETSGHTLALIELKLDCDADTWLVRAIPNGPTCHTGAQSCFGSDGSEPPPSELDALEATLRARIAATPGSFSYVRRLLDEGLAAVGAKVVEEAGELSVELARAEPDQGRIVAEAADLLFHVLVGLAARGLGLADVARELHRRAGVSGLTEKASRK